MRLVGVTKFQNYAIENDAVFRIGFGRLGNHCVALEQKPQFQNSNLQSV